MTGKRLDLDIDDLVKRYLAGESEKAIAQHLGVSRTAIRPRLIERGIEIRDRSAAMRQRMSLLTPQQRSLLTTAAHQARRGQVDSMETLSARALHNERTGRLTGAGEKALLKLLRKQGFSTKPQHAVGPYNIDIAVWPVAVEVHISPRHPIAIARHRKRVEYLANQGWHSLYVWVSRAEYIEPACVAEVIAHIERAQADPASIREHRVIRGRGQDAP